MKILYFDPIVGVSGDMILASLIDLGVNKNYLKQKLSFIGNFSIVVTQVNRAGVSAKNVSFKIHKRISEMQFLPLIRKSHLPPRIKQSASNIINRIFEVEKYVHRSKNLHLHELADADTLLDVVGALIAIDYLEVDAIYTRPVKAGNGFIKTVEGYMPSFNFATARLLKNFPIEFLQINEELITPTGAAILSSIATPCNALTLTSLERIGLGAGSKEIRDYPNLLRVFLGNVERSLDDECFVIETNIDDMNQQDYEVMFERVFQAGALDVFLTPVIMKNSRPGIMLTVICDKYNKKIIETIFKETSTLGIRATYVKRVILDRQIKKVKSPYGQISVKISRQNGRERFTLEYRDLKRIASKTGMTISEIRNRLTAFLYAKRHWRSTVINRRCPGMF